jgi:hypothetical protein
MHASMATLFRSALALALLGGMGLATAPVRAAEGNGGAADPPATGGVDAPMTSIAPRSPKTQVFTGPNGTDMQVGQHARGSAIPAPAGPPGQAGR